MWSLCSRLSPDFLLIEPRRQGVAGVFLRLLALVAYRSNGFTQRTPPSYRDDFELCQDGLLESRSVFEASYSKHHKGLYGGLHTDAMHRS